MVKANAKVESWLEPAVTKDRLKVTSTPPEQIVEVKVLFVFVLEDLVYPYGGFCSSWGSCKACARQSGLYLRACNGTALAVQRQFVTCTCVREV